VYVYKSFSPPPSLLVLMCFYMSAFHVCVVSSMSFFDDPIKCGTISGMILGGHFFHYLNQAGLLKKWTITPVERGMPGQMLCWKPGKMLLPRQYYTLYFGATIGGALGWSAMRAIHGKRPDYMDEVRVVCRVLYVGCGGEALPLCSLAAVLSKSCVYWLSCECCNGHTHTYTARVRNQVSGQGVPAGVSTHN
jgi:hypothetical protein